MKVARRFIGVLLAVAAGILVVHAILSFIHVGVCDLPYCPSPNGNTAIGELVAGAALLGLGAIAAVGASLLVFLLTGGIYALVRALAGPYGLLSSDGIVVVSFLAIPVLLLLAGSAAAIVGKPRDAVPDTGVTVHDDPASS